MPSEFNATSGAERPSPDLQTLAVHAGQHHDPETGAVAPPIHLATTFARRDDGSDRGYVYARENAPTRERLEEALAVMEGAAGAAAFASGLAATNAAFDLLPPGSRLLLPDDRYVGVGNQARTILPHRGIEVVELDMTDRAALDAALAEVSEAPPDADGNADARASAASRPRSMVWIETPSNPQLRITDVADVAARARAAGAIVACDATWCTPMITRPLNLGCDLVVHSTTKYVGGHSDVLGGVVAWREAGELADGIRERQILGGAVPSGFDAWLLLRGMRTMPLRLAAQCDGAMAIAEAMQAHPHVSRVLYPGLPTHPGHALAARQMDRFGAMLSIRVRGGEDAAARVARGTRWLAPATSLGGVESLIEHRAVVEGPTSRTPRDLLRISVGIESPRDLIDDLGSAIDRAHAG
ncbi:MAG: PLP-dependent aspartate aminotransferase family protein [Phycisphaerales bacterium]